MNKRLFFSISLVLVLCFASNASAGQLGWWTFDDSTANDSGPSGHDGTLVYGPCDVNEVTFVYDTGLVGSPSLPMDSNVAAFPGTIGTWIDCGGGRTAAPGDPCTWADILGDQMTMAAWVKTDGLWPSLPTYQYVFAKENAYRLSRNGTSRNLRMYLDNSLGGTLGGVDMDADDGQWHHIACTYDGTTKTIYWDGEFNADESAAGPMDPYTTRSVTIGGNAAYADRSWKGWIDDVRLYDSAEPVWRIRLWARNYKAYIPVPEDTADYQEKTLAEVSWTGLPMTDDYRVYLGTDETLVTNGDASVDKGVIAGGPGPKYTGAPMGALTLGTTYYWRVDANVTMFGVVAPGEVWEFETKPAWAENPWPIDTCKYVDLAQQLSWRAGDSAVTSEVFFSDNQQWVIDACDAIQTTITAPDPCVLSPALVADTTYYWKVDSDDGSVYTDGAIWSLSTDSPSPEAGMVGFWPMEETDAASGSVTWDISGKSHHGTFTQGDVASSISIVVDGVRGNVLRVDNLGSPAINSALDCGGSPSDIHDPCWGYVAQDQITMALWAKMEEGHTSDYLFTRGNNVQVCREVGTDRIRIYTGPIAGDTLFSSNPPLENQWHWIVVTYDRDANDLILYVDGAIKDIDTSSWNPIGTHTNDIVIGGRLDPGYNYRGFDGWIDDAKLYDIALPCWKIAAEGAQCGTCVGDLDANSVVNLADLGQLIGDLTMEKIATGLWEIPDTSIYWKNCSDMDNDGVITLKDLNRMIGNLTWEEITTGTPGTWSYPAGKYCP